MATRFSWIPASPSRRESQQKRIKCARCGERETVTKGERGPASIYCDLCRAEVKREQNALRAQAYRQRKRWERR